MSSWGWKRRKQISSNDKAATPLYSSVTRSELQRWANPCFTAHSAAASGGAFLPLQLAAFLRSKGGKKNKSRLFSTVVKIHTSPETIFQLLLLFFFSLPATIPDVSELHWTRALGVDVPLRSSPTQPGPPPWLCGLLGRIDVELFTVWVELCQRHSDTLFLGGWLLLRRCETAFGHTEPTRRAAAGLRSLWIALSALLSFQFPPLRYEQPELYVSLLSWLK